MEWEEPEGLRLKLGKLEYLVNGELSRELERFVFHRDSLGTSFK